MNITNLRLQVDEIDAIVSSYPDEEVLTLSEGETSDLAWARLLLQQTLSDTRDTTEAEKASDNNHWPSHLSGSLKCLEGKASVRLRYVFPPSYPEVSAHLSVECDPAIHREMSACLKEVSESEPMGEGGQLLLAFSALREALREGCGCHTLPADQTEGSTAKSTGPETRQRIVRALIWFHHIAANSKRRFIVERARELGIRGASKPGWPGVVVCQGGEEAVEEFIIAIKSLGWQAIQVRCLEPLTDSDKRGFQDEFHEVESEGGMSALATICQDAGCIDLFTTYCLKL